MFLLHQDLQVKLKQGNQVPKERMVKQAFQVFQELQVSEVKSDPLVYVTTADVIKDPRLQVKKCNHESRPP